MQHPLINPDSKHYDSSDREPAILELEKKLTVDEMIGACKFNIHKYEYRLDKKGQKYSDMKKIQTYKNYLNYLYKLSEKMYKNNINGIYPIRYIREQLQEPGWEY